MGVKRVLIAVDDSPVAARAGAVGSELARSLGAELAFIHVVDPSDDYGPERGVPASDFIASAERDGKQLLGRFLERTGEGTPSPLAFSSVGKPSQEIVKAAKDWPADIIVVGSHGRGGVKRVVLGSVAEGVMRHAPCPVLVVRAAE